MLPRPFLWALGALFLCGLSACDDYVAGVPRDGGSGGGSGGEEGGDSGGEEGTGEGEDSGLDPICAQDYSLTWDNWGSSFFATYCDSCHAASSPNRFGAPEDATFDTEQEVIDQWDAVYTTVIEIEWMPLGGGVYPDDLYLLEVYLKCSL